MRRLCLNHAGSHGWVNTRRQDDKTTRARLRPTDKKVSSGYRGGEEDGGVVAEAVLELEGN